MPYILTISQREVTDRSCAIADPHIYSPCEDSYMYTLGYKRFVNNGFNNTNV